MTSMKPTAVIAEFVFLHVCLTPCSVPAGLSLIGNLAAWNSRSNFYRHGRQPKLPTSGRTGELKETRKHLITYQHKEGFPVLVLNKYSDLSQTWNNHASVSYPSLLWPWCPLVIGPISVSATHPACPLPVCFSARITAASL